jgi:hypothetical protein
MEEAGEDSMIYEGNVWKEDEMEVMVKCVTGTSVLFQFQRQVSAFKTFKVKFISFTVDTLHKLGAAIFLSRS